MTKLFDENNEFQGQYYRTLWYGYLDSNLDDSLIKKIKSILATDLSTPLDNPPLATHWVFYTGEVGTDALGEAVRPSLMVRKSVNQLDVHYNYSDFAFVSTFDFVESFVQNLKTQLQNTVTLP